MARPSKYKEEMGEVVIDMMSQGCGVMEVCAELKITKDTFYRWAKEKEAFSDAFKIGRQLCQAWWERQGRINLKDKTFNHVLWFFNMKNRFYNDWNDKRDINVTGKVESKSDKPSLENLTADELKQYYILLRRARGVESLGEEES